MLLLWHSVYAAAPQYHIDCWTTDQGLPQNSILDILQTRDHYLWLTTADGLVRFDGLHFTVFNKSNSRGIESNRFTSLYEDHEGALWIGTDSAGVTRNRNGIFSTYSAQQELVSQDWVKGITGDSAGHLWMLIGTQIMRWTQGRLVPLTADSFPNREGAQFSIIGPDGAVGFWSRDEAALALFLHGRTSIWTRRSNLPTSEIRAVAEDTHGTVWIASDRGLAKIDGNKFVTVSRSPGCSPGPTMSFVFTPELNLICKDTQNALSIINTVSLERQQISHLPSALLENLAHAVYYGDLEKNIWIGTGAAGLYRARKQIVSVYTEAQGLLDHNIYPIYQDHAGSVWLGVWRTSLSRIQNGNVTNYTKRDGLSGEEITALFEDRSGRLWVGAYGNGNGLRVFQNGRFVVPRGLENLGVVSAIFEDRQGAFWFGTEDKLVRYADGALTTFTRKDGLATPDARVIIDDPAGDLWIGGNGGLTRLHHGSFTAFTERDGLPSNSVRALYLDSDGVLWIGTYDGGLGRFKDGKFTRYTTHEGLFNNGVFQILEDLHGNFWMSSNQGIYRVQKCELNEFAAGRRSAITSIAYGKSDGLLNIECNGGRWPAGIKTRDGKLWFPTQDGAAVIDPSGVSTNPEAPPVRIDSILVEHAPVAFDRPVRLQPGRGNLEIHYTALSFIDSDRIRFKYKLEGLDHNWVDGGTRRTAYYSHLPPGNYVFRVIAANSDGVWNMQGRSIGFRMLPAFYETWWFRTLVFLYAAGLIYLAWRYRVMQLERTHALQQAFTRELISSQESERKRIAAELHDSLGQHLVVIKNLALISLNNGAGGGATRSRIEEISGEASQALGEVREISFNLRPYQLDRLGLRKAVEAIVKKASRTTTIAFTAEIDDIDDIFPKDLEINFYRIVQECISNLIKHSEATAARLEIRRVADRLLLTIRDNGKGFTPGVTDRTRSSGGFGLIGLSERSQLLGGKPEIDSAPGRGTVIRIEMPLGKGREY